VKRREIEKSRAALEARGNGLSWRDVAAETSVHKDSARILVSPGAIPPGG